MREPNRRDFTNARANATRRGIAWHLTFEQWAVLWRTSGKYDQRGRKRGQFQMDRIDNARGYYDGNVQIVSGTVNRTKDSPHGWQPKLSEAAVRDIRMTFRKGVRGWRYFAEKFDVSIATIKAVLAGRNWRRVAE